MELPESADPSSQEAAQGWQELNRRIRDFLGEMTLADFVEVKSERANQNRNSVSNYIASMFPAQATRSGMSV